MKRNLLLLALCIALVNFYCKKERSCEHCTSTNKSPIAIAGYHLVITLPTDSILLDGSASRDPDGRITEWLWKLVLGPASMDILNATRAKAVLKNFIAGSYKFELSVKDDKGASARDTVMVTIDAAPTTNHAPLAIAGPDQLIALPTNSVMLDAGASSDPENNITGYVWTKISGPSSFKITNPNAIQTQITNLVEGFYQFELELTDAGMLVSKDTVAVKVVNFSGSLNTFTNQVWISTCYQPDMPGACWVNGDAPSYGFTIKDTANVLPNSSAAIFGVWVRMDTSNVWEQVPHKCWQYPDSYPQSNFTYCLTPDSLTVSSWFFSFVNLAGRKADVKIAF